MFSDSLAASSSSSVDIEIDWADLDRAPCAIEPDITERTPTVPTSGSFDAPTINEAARDLANLESETLAAHGIGASEQLFDTGTALMDIGHENLERYEQEYRALPPPSTAIADLKATIEGEARRDEIVDLTKYRIDAEGRLAPHTTLAGGPLRVEETAWRQLTAIAGQNVNAGLHSRTSAVRRVRTRAVGDKGRSSYAIVSSDKVRGYSIFDANQVADLVMSGLRDARLLDGAKCEVKYDAATTRYKIRVILQAPIDIAAFRGVGRVHRVFMDVCGGDNGMASVEGHCGALRVRCMNASLSQAVGTTWSRIHKGNPNDIQALVGRMGGQFAAVARDMSDVWSRAAGNYYLDSDGGRLSPREAITRLVAHGYVPTNGLTPEAATDMYMAAWRAEESPESADGIIMAIQRAAHETTWRTTWGTEDTEEAASNLLYQKVYTLAEVSA